VEHLQTSLLQEKYILLRNTAQIYAAQDTIIKWYRSSMWWGPALAYPEILIGKGLKWKNLVTFFGNVITMTSLK